MKTITFRIPEETKEAFKEKAGLVAISRIIRILINKYLKGEIDIE